jgi:hypothetical protein
MPDSPASLDEEELPPYLGGRLAQSLRHHFEEFFGPGYIHKPEPWKHKETQNEE